MKRKVLLISLTVLTVVAVIIFAFKPFGGNKSSVTFETVKVEKGSITNTVTATGTIKAITTVEVGTQVSGIIKEIFVDFNDVVKEGQVIAKIDETNLLEQLRQAQASLDQALAQLRYHEATYNRIKVLYEKNLVAQADYDQALLNYENAKASVSNAKSAVSRAKVNLDYATITSPIDGVVLNRAVEEGQTVAASFNTPTLFTIANDLTQMEVQTSVDEADIGKVKVGQRVEFTVDAYPDMKFEGSVSQVRLQPVTTNNVVTYTVVINAPNPDKKLMPGMTASATIFVEEKDNTLYISGKALRFNPSAEYLRKMMEKFMKENRGKFTPPQGIQTQAGGASQMPVLSSSVPQSMSSMPQGGMPGFGANDPSMKTVWVRAEEGQIRLVPVKTGIDNGSFVEILSGLNENDEVIISMVEGQAKATASSSRNNGGPRGPFPF